MAVQHLLQQQQQHPQRQQLLPLGMTFLHLVNPWCLT
jgi:hypothetical protein